MVSSRILNAAILQQYVLSSALAMVVSKNEDVANAWLEVIDKLLSVVPASASLSDV